MEYKYEDFKNELSDEKGLVEKVIIDEYGNKISMFHYLFQFGGLFSNDVIREFRGITFINEGKGDYFLGLHKFFGINQRESTMYGAIKDKKIKEVVEKVDGSMVNSVIIDGEIIMKSKFSIESIQSVKATEIVNKNEDYKKFVMDLYNMGLFPIFEFVSYEDRVVVEYDKDELILLQIRDWNGNYMNIEDFDSPFKLREKYTHFKNLDEVMKWVDEQENYEGVVIVFEDGQFVKYKSKWYNERHDYIFDNFNDKRLMESLLDDTIDDVISSGLLSDKDLESVDAKMKIYVKFITDAVSLIKSFDYSLDRRDFYSSIRGKGWDNESMDYYSVRDDDELVNNIKNKMAKDYYRLKNAVAFFKDNV